LQRLCDAALLVQEVSLAQQVRRTSSGNHVHCDPASELRRSLSGSLVQVAS
jgi:hypothetical protein